MARITQVSSTKSPFVQRVRAAAAGESQDLMTVDGARVVGEVMDAGLRVELAVLTERFAASSPGLELRLRLESRARDMVIATDPVFERMSSLTTPQGVLVIARRPEWSSTALLGRDPNHALIVVAAGVRDPGNLGAMLRATEAAGGTGFIALAGSADPFRDKAVRGSSGSILRVPTQTDVTADALVEMARSRGLRLLTTDGAQGTDYLDTDLRAPTLLVLGSEGQGVPAELAARAQGRIRIPLIAPVESLNVAVATGVLLFEARRQRR